MKRTAHMTQIRFKPIGVIRTAFREPAGTPIQPSRAGAARGTVEVFREYADGLKDLDGFERVWLIYWLDRAPKPRLLVTPFLDDRERGLFATRAPGRPNAIGISSVRLLRVAGNKLEVAEVDILNGTPLLDIKPYVPEFDCHSVRKSGWFDHAPGHGSVADNRFERKKPAQPK
ncbi:MAG: tRNA (N6-threonylcarbamoyladenosine(37)-N6)-methyltransferase TrmO [Candidatus Binataceae bacterium]